MIADIAAFAILIGSPPVPPVPVTAAPASLALAITTVEFPLADVVGPVRAGLLCLPRGKARGSDFLRSPEDLRLLLHQAASQVPAPGGMPANLQIGFRALRVKLCARSWGAFGIGHSDALSGDAEFVFDWSVGASSPSARQVARIRIEIGKDQAMSPDAILRTALDRLIVQIRQKSDHNE